MQRISLAEDPMTQEGLPEDVVAWKKEEHADSTHKGKVAEYLPIQINLAEEETRKWRSQVTSDLNALKGKLWELDRLTTRHRHSMKQITSYAEIEEDKCCGLITLAYLVKTSWASRLQLILLLTGIIFFGWYATCYFWEARENERAVWKPLKITQAIEYGNTNMQYEMPYVLIAFSVTYSGNASTSIISETLSGIGASQRRRRSRCTLRYFSSERKGLVECEWSVSRYEGRPTGSMSTFWGYFRFKLENPTPANGSFVWSVNLTASDMVFNDNIQIGGFWVSITRDEIPSDFSNFIFLNAESPLANNAGVAYTVDYTETIVNDKHYIANSIAWSSQMSSNGIFQFTARPNLRVESYTEYVVFGYSDWVFGMGGLYNVFAVGFFYAAYYAAVFCNDNYWSMGILPRLSFIFQNFELILWLKHNTLGEEDIDGNDLTV